MKDDRKTINVLIYCRVSTDEQRKGTSVDVQEDMLRRYCAYRGYNIIERGEFKEDESAKTFEKRPVMQAILKYIDTHKGQVDKLLFIRWNRFSRDSIEAPSVIKKLRSKGVEPNATEEPVNFKSTNWPSQIAQYLGQAHSDNLGRSQATIDGIFGTLEKGKCANKAPRGYVNKHFTDEKGITLYKYVEIDKEKAAPIKKAFEELAKGNITVSYARKKYCPHIAESTFADMLRNPFYMGKVRVKERIDKVTEEVIPEHNVDGQHEPLITEATFNAVQEVIKGKRKGCPKQSNVSNPLFFLKKFMVCPVCGRAITGSSSKGNGGRYGYYHCNRNSKHIRKRAEKVNEDFIKYISCLVPNDTVLNLYKEVLDDMKGEKRENNRVEAAKLKVSLDGIQKRIAKAKDMFVDGDLSKVDKDEIVNRNQREADIIQQKIDMLLCPDKQQLDAKMKYSISLLANLDKVFRDAPVEVKVKLLGSMFPDKIEFDGKNYRTKSYNKVLDLIYQQTNELQSPKKVLGRRFKSSPQSVPRAGVEPARVAPLVFETSASTDSAIWAFAMQSYTYFPN